MNRYFRWALRVVAQVVVAAGFTQALDAWIDDLDPPWHRTVLALAQPTVAVAQAYLESRRAVPPVCRPATRSAHQRTRRLRADR